ncbi:MAG: histidine phosphatase family protein [Clostridia bacterium]|nr:histidine phosphatase family protein [Clostridia bacterium]
MIYIVRHGQTDWNIEKKTQGHTDIPLNENGRNQAKRLAQSLQNVNIDKIISSDLIRAKETAKIINEQINKEIIYDKRLREINYGLLEGINRDTLTPDVWDTFNNFPEKLKAEDKESIFSRVKECFDEILNDKENILIVTHGGVLRMIMFYKHNRDKFNNDIYLKEYNNVKINNADIFEWDNI